MGSLAAESQLVVRGHRDNGSLSTVESCKAGLGPVTRGRGLVHGGKLCGTEFKLGGLRTEMADKRARTLEGYGWSVGWAVVSGSRVHGLRSS